MGLRRVGKIWWLDIRIKSKRYRRSLKTENRNEALDSYKEKKDELLAEYAGKKYFVIIREIKYKYNVEITKKDIREAMLKEGR